MSQRFNRNQTTWRTWLAWLTHLSLVALVGCTVETGAPEMEGAQGDLPPSSALGGAAPGDSVGGDGVTDSTTPAPGGTNLPPGEPAGTDPGSIEMGDGETGTTTPAATGTPAPPGTGACEEMSEGVFAYKAEVDVWWGKDGAITKPGRGVVTQYFMTEQQYPDGDLKFQGTLKGCGASLPPFHAAPICESYQATFEVWEDVPPIAIKGSWDCLDPGCTGSLEPQVLSIGMSLDDPRGDWPQPKDLGSLSCPEGSTVDCFPDHDGDGMPGMTATMLTSGVSIAGDPDFLICLGGDRQFTGAPPGPVESLIPGQPRVEEIFLGLRVGMGGEMTLNDSCSGGSGGGTVQYIDARSVDCTLDDGNACPVSASSFTDEQLPVYHPLNVGDVPPDAIGLIAIDDTSVSAGPAFEAVRLGDLGAGFSCADAVAALK